MLNSRGRLDDSRMDLCARDLPRLDVLAGDDRFHCIGDPKIGERGNSDMVAVSGLRQHPYRRMPSAVVEPRVARGPSAMAQGRKTLPRHTPWGYRLIGDAPRKVKTMTVTTYQVGGMTCGHCVSTVKGAVGSVRGAEHVEVDLAAGTVTVTGSPSDDAVVQAISQAGYDAVPAGSDAAAGRGLPPVASAGGCCCR
jgi:copper chaperone